MPKAGLRTFVIFLNVVVVASSQTLAPKSLPKGPLEKYDNPPTLSPAVATSPGLISQFGPYTSYQVNVNANGNNIVGDAANEPSICVDPTNGNQMSIGWRQFDSVASNFRQAGFAHTTNGGRTWISAGVLQQNVFRSDPVLNSDNIGRFFYLSLLQDFFDDLWRSLNGGQSWANIAPANGGDKQWFTIDNTNSTGHGFQYQFWSTDGNNYGGRQFSRSINGGVSWMNPINIPNSPAWGTLDVDSNGNLFIGGVNLNTNQIWCLRSTNAKNGAVVPTFDRSAAVNLGGHIAFGEPINPEGLVGQVFLAVDRSGTSTNNNVYMLASVQPAGATNGSDVMFARSTNGGQTFSAPRRINDDPVNHAKWHWFGTLSVAPNGRIDAVWLDTRNAANNANSQVFYSSSQDGGNTWSPNVAISNSFNPFLGYPNQDKLGDYITVVSDNAGANVAYAATFNGEEDVYYVHVAPASPTPTPTPTARAAVGDFNGDGHPDFVVQNPSTHQTVIGYLNNNVLIGAAYGPTLPGGWSLEAVADFNRDSSPDYALFVP
ncbi:MAG TPA: FG-GAP-like repeat-containing protein, partial [Candidatus Udaeobacter sp.]|nr:FG-GAP-like repeat-containing protein [Candidatus Udaeobacter sp.]